MARIHSKILVLLSFFTLALVSCDKIYEDKTDCPTVVYTDFSKMGEHIRNVQLWLEDSKGNSFSKLVLKSDFGHFEHFSLSKGVVKCYAWGNVHSATICSVETKNSPKMMLIKRDNILCDSLYLFSTMKVVNKDTTVIIITPHKQFATIYLKFVNAQWCEKIKTTLISSAKGFYYDGEIISGSSFSGSEVFNDISILRLLRQNTLSDLVINVEYYDGSSWDEYKIDLSKYLIESRYDMKQEDLKDIFLTVDFSNFTTQILIGDWDVIPVEDVEI